MAAKMAAKSIFSQILASFRNPLTVIGDFRVVTYSCGFARLDKHTCETFGGQVQGQIIEQVWFPTENAVK